MSATPDTVDFFREREKLAWSEFAAAPSAETLHAWWRAFRNMNDEVLARAAILATSVRTSGKPGRP